MDIIVGGGRYGVEAARFLERKSRGYVVLDRNPECAAMKELDLVKVSSADEIKGEGKYFLEGELSLSCPFSTLSRNTSSQQPPFTLQQRL